MLLFLSGLYFTFEHGFEEVHCHAWTAPVIIIITRVSGQVHCAYSCKSTLVQDKQDTTRRPVT
jgi:hypothetical protein